VWEQRFLTIKSRFCFKISRVFEGGATILPKCNALLTSLMGLAVMLSLLSQSIDFVQETGGIREEDILAAVPRIEIVQGSFKPHSTFVATLADFDVPSDLA